MIRRINVHLNISTEILIKKYLIILMTEYGDGFSKYK